MNWKTTKEEHLIIRKIVKRTLLAHPDLGLDFMNLEMNLAAVHANGTPLNLQDLLDAKDADLYHDVFGIDLNIDRETGKLSNCFLPRYAKPH